MTPITLTVVGCLLWKLSAALPVVDVDFEEDGRSQRVVSSGDLIVATVWSARCEFPSCLPFRRYAW